MNKPVLRFEGFSDEWIEKELGKIANFSKGRGYSKSDITDDGTPIILYGRMYTNYQCDINDVDTFCQPKPNSVYSSGKEVIVPASGETAEDISIASAIKKSGIILGGDLNIVIPFDNTVDTTFLAHSVSNGQPKKSLSKKAQGKTIVHLHNSDIKEVGVNFPSLPEQQKIGSFFRALDRLISSRQKRYDKLLGIKAALLQKMFPKQGESVPEIRFEGFCGEWETRKVSDMFKVTRGFVLAATLTSKKSSKDMPYPVYSSQTLDGGLMGYYKDYLYEDAITWTTDGANAGTVNFRSGKFYCTNVCGVLLSKEVKASKVIAESLNMVTKGYVSYVGNPKLMNNVMAEIEIKIPVSPIEQDKISNLFISLDRLISLCGAELDKLKNIKKSCLEKMFV